jgi:hypothetical protein
MLNKSTSEDDVRYGGLMLDKSTSEDDVRCRVG